MNETITLETLKTLLPASSVFSPSSQDAWHYLIACATECEAHEVILEKGVKTSGIDPRYFRDVMSTAIWELMRFAYVLDKEGVVDYDFGEEANRLLELVENSIALLRIREEKRLKVRDE
jgi:hypothetical protein